MGSRFFLIGIVSVPFLIELSVTGLFRQWGPFNGTVLKDGDKSDVDTQNMTIADNLSFGLISKESKI